MIQRRFSRWPVALIFSLTCLNGVLAQEFKIGFVSHERIMREANQAKAAQVRLEQEFSKREKDVQALSVQLKAVSEKFEREAPTLSEVHRVARQRQLVELERDFQRRQRELQEDLSLRRSEEIQSLLEKANKVIKLVAEAEKYDLIIQEAVYISPRHDITDKVLSGLNAGK